MYMKFSYKESTHHYISIGLKQFLDLNYIPGGPRSKVQETVPLLLVLVGGLKKKLNENHLEIDC